MNDRAIDLLSLEPAAMELLRECEVSGKRTVFLRNGLPVAILISQDEYTALRETVDLAGSERHAGLIAAADDQIRRGALLQVEDLLVE
jgi:PHD/YefM family antitoxin component YafN of YafNO toxin-antitoxin module